MVYLIYVLIGALAGLLSGLLGIGGGIVIVPALLIVFHFLHFNPHVLMHLVIGTSFSVIVLTTLRSYFSHRQYEIAYKSIFLRLLPGAILGAISGSVLAHFIHSQFLKVMFGAILSLVSIWMLLPINFKKQRNLPGRVSMSIASYIFAGLCGMIGVSGGPFFTPYLSFYQIDIRRCVITAVLLGFVISVICVIVFIISGLHVSGLPAESIGYVYWPAWLAVTVGSVLCAPLGAKLSHRMPVKLLRKAFAIFLLIVGVHMIFF